MASLAIGLELDEAVGRGGQSMTIGGIGEEKALLTSLFLKKGSRLSLGEGALRERWRERGMTSKDSEAE
ncbi:MAG: hypothetical protein HC769_30970 [Cyanobacteria bacterium CRU_2_1]|nr:hypothetical protein [Cyanobacteria bacterium CRU_2_1]